MPDNIAYQPGRGNWIIHEDGDGPEVGRNNGVQHNVTRHGVILEIAGWR